MAMYESDFPRFMNDTDEQKRFNAAKVKQKPYVYQPE